MSSSQLTTQAPPSARATQCQLTRASRRVHAHSPRRTLRSMLMAIWVWFGAMSVLHAQYPTQAQAQKPQAQKPQAQKPQAQKPQAQKPQAQSDKQTHTSDTPLDVSQTASQDAPQNTSQSTSQSTSQNNEDSPPSKLSDVELETRIESNDDQQRLEAIWEDFKRNARGFVEESRYHRELQRQSFEQLYKRQRDKIEGRYQAPIKNAEDTASEQRRESIARFRAFLESYKPHPQYTPDSLYRLGMLLLEESDSDFERRRQEYDRRIEEAGDADIDIPYPQRDQQQVISVFSQLIQNWPRYRELDAALYARGYCYYEIGEEQIALRDFKTLVKRFPESDYYTIVWNIIGEIHFEFAELSEAVEAYSEVIKDKESKLYAPAFYKLAWTYYRNDQFEEAVETFKALVSYSDKQTSQGKRGFDLRNEALQYLAISLNEDDWDGDGITDMDAGLSRIKRYLSSQESYQAELLAKLVGIFFENTKYEEAIQTAQHLFKLHPFYHENPQIHAQTILAFDRVAQPQKAFIERDRITNLYVKDGPWYAYNHRNQGAIDKARGLMQDALIQAAKYHHSNAQQLKSRADEVTNDGDMNALKSQATKSYMKAALAYQRYLDRYKRDKNTYEILYNYADTLFFSGEYQRAFDQYLIVRESDLGEQYKQESALSVILAHDELVKIAIRKGALPPKPSTSLTREDTSARASSEEQASREAADKSSSEASGDAKDKANARREPEEFPNLIQEAITVRQSYLDLKLESPDSPYLNAEMIYRVGELSYDYAHIKEARERFIDIIQNHPKAPVAPYAAASLIETYRVEKNWAEIERWAGIIESKLGDSISDQAKTWKVGALFKSASQLYAQKNYKEAAREYLRLVKDNPKHENTSKALYNAAVAFEFAKMFDSAMKTFERVYREYPKSEFAETALFRVAYNAQRFYNYDHAVKTFVELARRYPKGENAAGATYNAARLLEQTQQYKRATKAYRDYAQRFPDQDNAAESFYSVARCYEKLGDWRKQIKTYNLFIKRYGADEKHNARVIRSLAEIVKIYEKKRNLKRTFKTQQRLIKEVEKRNLVGRLDIADFPAESAFKLLENDFLKFKRIKVGGSRRSQDRGIKKMKAEIARLSVAYSKVLVYKSLSWSIAVFYRLAIMRRLFAQMLYDLPLPPNLTMEEEDIYTTEIEKIAVPIEDEAVQRLETAIKKAREFRISNEWTKKILEVLHLYKPEEYPTFKDEKRLNVEQIKSSARFVLPEGARDTSDQESQTSDEPTGPSTPETPQESAQDLGVGETGSVGTRAAKTPPISEGGSLKEDQSDVSESPDVQRDVESATVEDIEPLEDLEEVQ